MRLEWVLGAGQPGLLLLLLAPVLCELLLQLLGLGLLVLECGVETGVEPLFFLEVVPHLLP